LLLPTAWYASLNTDKSYNLKPGTSDKPKSSTIDSTSNLEIL
jgi:hypothetical protein